MKIESYGYYISDHAYNQLVTYAQLTGYIKTGAERMKGMSEFLNALAQGEFDDARSEYIIKLHKQEKSYGRAPTWTSRYPRRTRLLRLTDDAMARFLLLANRMDILPSEPHAIGGVSRTNPIPAISLILEGIGNKWLMPVKLPRSKQDE